MPKRRSYKQFCGVARALDVVGERWTLLVVRNLLLGPRRYSDLLRELPGVTTNLLAKRLRELEDAGLVERRDPAGPGGTALYALTARGAELEPVIMELGRWGGSSMTSGPRRDDTVSLGWALLSSKRRYGGGVSCVLDVREDPKGKRGTVPGERFELVFEPARMSVEQRQATRPDVTVMGTGNALLRAFANPDPADAAAAIGQLRIEGDGAKWRAILGAMGRA